MASITTKLSGCYRRVLIFLLAIVAVSLLVGAFAYNRLGGLEGLRHWMAERALNGVEKHVLANRPDGIPQEQVVAQFKSVREAVRNRRVVLTQLYEALKSYQNAVAILERAATGSSAKLSTPEVEQFLTALAQTIVLED